MSVITPPTTAIALTHADLPPFLKDRCYRAPHVPFTSETPVFVADEIKRLGDKIYVKIVGGGWHLWEYADNPIAGVVPDAPEKTWLNTAIDLGPGVGT